MIARARRPPSLRSAIWQRQRTGPGRARTDRRGRATVVRRLRRSGNYVARATKRGLRRLERTAHHLLDRLPFAPQLHLAALNARHVEQIVDERVHPSRLISDCMRNVTLYARELRLRQA